jgi:iron-sulfur cluster assembly protein
MVSITGKAAGEALRIIADNGLSAGAGVRVGVKSGGCSGLNYILDIVDEKEQHDRVFSIEGVQIFCDPKSYLYLNGTEIGFESKLTGGGFTFNNPNAKRSCGCGTSFAV